MVLIRHDDTGCMGSSVSQVLWRHATGFPICLLIEAFVAPPYEHNPQ